MEITISLVLADRSNQDVFSYRYEVDKDAPSASARFGGNGSSSGRSTGQSNGSSLDTWCESSTYGPRMKLVRPSFIRARATFASKGMRRGAVLDGPQR